MAQLVLEHWSGGSVRSDISASCLFIPFEPQVESALGLFQVLFFFFALFILRFAPFLIILIPPHV